MRSTPTFGRRQVGLLVLEKIPAAGPGFEIVPRTSDLSDLEDETMHPDAIAFTVEDLVEVSGFSKSTIRRRIRKLGLKPINPAAWEWHFDRSVAEDLVLALLDGWWETERHAHGVHSGEKCSNVWCRLPAMAGRRRCAHCRLRSRQNRRKELGIPLDAPEKPWSADGPLERRARHAVMLARQRGELPPPTICVYCGRPGGQYDHFRLYSGPYAKENWLEVKPSCPKCNMRRRDIYKLCEALRAACNE